MRLLHPLAGFLPRICHLATALLSAQGRKHACSWVGQLLESGAHPAACTHEHSPGLVPPPLWVLVRKFCAPSFILTYGSCCRPGAEGAGAVDQHRRLTSQPARHTCSSGPALRPVLWLLQLSERLRMQTPPTLPNKSLSLMSCKHNWCKLGKRCCCFLPGPIF